MNTMVRGVKIDEDRPDFFVLDDLDSIADGPTQIEHKIETLTTSILPAGRD